MTDLLYFIMAQIARVHSFILRLNDSFEYNFTDKELHFFVIGILGMLMVFAIYPIFRYLARKNHIMVITWIYVFTLIIVLTFAIEIGQRVSHTGVMEFADIAFGVIGFLIMFSAFCIVRSLYHGILKLLHRHFQKNTD